MLPPQLGPPLHVKHASSWPSINTNEARLTITPDASATVQGGQISTGEGGSVSHRRRQITEPSPLIRDGPPLCPAQLLSPSQFRCLGFSPETTGRGPQPLHWPTVPSGRQVPEFHTRARTTLAPPSRRTPPGQSTGTRQTHPRATTRPWFRCRRYAFDASSVVRFRSPS